MFSLPCYCKEYEQIPLFFKKALLGLAPNGNLRAFPVNLSYLHLLPNGMDLDIYRIREIFEKFCEDLIRNTDVQITTEIKKQLFDTKEYKLAKFTAPKEKAEFNKYLDSI
jgi:hypothetical protein